MWIYEKKLQYPVKIKNPDPMAAQIIISQLGGPDGELAASMLSRSHHKEIHNQSIVFYDVDLISIQHLHMLTMI